jgi:hypothetical protein
VVTAPVAGSTRWIEPPWWLGGVGPGTLRPPMSMNWKLPPLLAT